MTPLEIARRAHADRVATRPAVELLSRYATPNDAEAFAGMVHQFGPMVLGTCRRVLGQAADADDAFQLVFLALARQAGTFRDPAALLDLLRNWAKLGSGLKLVAQDAKAVLERLEMLKKGPQLAPGAKP
ncbi:MAG TPA: sigma factor [Gemmataceae bacterium]|nr:sigma factor [Gemmataceae bacterium]